MTVGLLVLLVLLHVCTCFAFTTSVGCLKSDGIFPTRTNPCRRSPWFHGSQQSCSFLQSSILGDEDRDDERNNYDTSKKDLLRDYHDQESINYSRGDVKEPQLLQSLLDGIPFIELFRERRKLPPIQVDDTNLLLYDIFLIVNLTLSISFWVTYRMDFTFLPIAFSEGCLLSIFWIVSGLYHGMFLYSAVDGHYGSADERGGPKAAATLALNTFINAVNLRLLFALLVAVAEHRPVGMASGEQLLPLEIGFGLLLMSSWRAIHSFITPRI